MGSSEDFKKHLGMAAEFAPTPAGSFCGLGIGASFVQEKLLFEGHAGQPALSNI